jgi:hypothetical protein
LPPEIAWRDRASRKTTLLRAIAGSEPVETSRYARADFAVFDVGIDADLSGFDNIHLRALLNNTGRDRADAEIGIHRARLYLGCQSGPVRPGCCPAQLQPEFC